MTLTNWNGSTTPGGGLIGAGSTRPSAAIRFSIVDMKFSGLRSVPNVGRMPWFDSAGSTYIAFWSFVERLAVTA